MDDKIKLLIVDDGRLPFYKNMAREISKFLPGADVQVVAADAETTSMQSKEDYEARVRALGGGLAADSMHVVSSPRNMGKSLSKALALTAIHATLTASAQVVSAEPGKPNNPYYRQFEKKGRKK